MEYAIDNAVFETDNRHAVRSMLQQYYIVSERIDEVDEKDPEFRSLCATKQSLFNQMVRISKFLYNM